MSSPSQPKRRPLQKVVTIHGKPLPVDEISDTELQELSDIQAATWRMERDAHEAVARLDARIKAGAVICSTQFAWDAKNRMVRTRKKA